MDTKQLQAELQKLKLVPFEIVADGVPGRRTMAAVDALLAQSDAEDWIDWADGRRRVAAEQLTFKNVGIEVGKIDGLVGEQTRYARSVWDARRKIGGGKIDPEVERWRDKEVWEPPQRPNVWPRQDQMESFYGKPGTGWVPLEMPFPLRLAWAPTTRVWKVQVHGKCKDAFSRIWGNTMLHYGYEELKRLRLDMFGGCGNVRKMRGGSRWSTHSWAAAWDVDPDRNQLKWGRDKASLDDAKYKRFWEIVEAEGAISLGRVKNYDWMHFQFTRDLS